jgi:monoamine oxidase
MAVEADYCVCTLPAPYVAKLDAPFSVAKRSALASVAYSKAAKVAWQAPRFWEEGGIYGGLAWTDQPSELVWYPSGNWNAATGVLVGAYAVGWLDGDVSVARFCAMSFDERFAMSRGVIERLHPGKSSLLSKPLTVAWDQTQWSGGVGAEWKPEQRKTDYLELCRPEDRVFFAGEHLSYVPY